MQFISLAQLGPSTILGWSPEQELLQKEVVRDSVRDAKWHLKISTRDARMGANKDSYLPVFLRIVFYSNFLEFNF